MYIESEVNNMTVQARLNKEAEEALNYIKECYKKQAKDNPFYADDTLSNTDVIKIALIRMAKELNI